MNPVHALANLVAARDALTSIGVRPFLVDGTLLGAVREGGFIAHDRDTDMGVFIEEYSPSIAPVMVSAGFRLSRTFGTVTRGLEMAFRRAGVKLDVFFYYRDGSGRFHAAWPKDASPIRYRYPAFALAPMEFLGETFLAPADPVAFCEAKYGLGWRDPVIAWDWRWGPANAQPWGVA